jgi:outer membrane receptor for ferrienterochelin and colicins
MQYQRVLSIAIMLVFSGSILAQQEVPLAVLSDIVIKNQDDHSTDSWCQLRDELVKTETIDSKSIERSNASNVLEAVDNRPGVSVQSECSVCNARNITLNNMPGRFTTLMVDGVPLYSSLSSGYGLDGISTDGIERIEISRGAGVSMNAPEALAGTVNMVTKRPVVAETILKGQLGSFGDLRTGIYLGQPVKGGAYSVSLDRRIQDAVDGAGYGISQSAGFERNNLGVAYFVDNLAGFRWKGRFDVLQEDRNGGALGKNYAGIKANTAGNPFNFSAGANGSPIRDGWLNADGSGFTTYDSGLAGFSQIIRTERQQAILQAERKMTSGTLRFAAGIAHNYQDSFYGGDALYSGNQGQTYLSASYQFPVQDNLFTLGADYRGEDLRSQGYSFASNQVNYGVDNYSYRSNAVYGQVYRAFFDNSLETNASVRVDEHNVFGTIVSPRFNALYHHNNAYSSRFSAGRGFSAPTSFFEQDHGLLADSKIVRVINKAETSDNVSYALNYVSENFSWVASLNYNRINNMARLTPNIDDGNGGTYTLFDASSDPVTIKGIDWVGTVKLTSTLAVSLGLEHFDYDFTPGALTFARPNDRAYLLLDYDYGAWDLMGRVTWTGSQDLAKFYNYATTQQYNLDGTVKRNTSPDFLVADMRAAYRWDKTYSGFIGVNNVFDYQQSQIDSYLWTDAAGNMDVTHIWGPNLGRQVYAGVRMSL